MTISRPRPSNAWPPARAAGPLPGLSTCATPPSLGWQVAAEREPPLADGAWPCAEASATSPVSVVAVYVEAGVVAIPPIGAAGVERPALQPVAFGGVVIGTVGKGHAVQQMGRERIAMTMVVVMTTMVVAMFVMAMMTAMMMAVMMTEMEAGMKLQPLREPFNRPFNG